MMLSRKQYLVAVEVPWMVSPSVPYLQLNASEAAADDLAAVSFIAHFGLEWPSTQLNEKRFEKVHSPYASGIKLTPPTGPFQLVKVKFASAIASRMLPGFSDREIINPEIYDSSNLPCGYSPGQSISEWKRQFQHTWVQNRLCPDPRMYEVSSSLWIEELGVGGEFKHFLIEGHDAYVEIIAKKWDWISEGGLPH